VGTSLFVLGLFKKVVIADTLATFATPVFDAAARGAAPDLAAAWVGALAYTFQLYFDFSGYTDMAIGGARLFGIRLPANFDSPYRATSIIDFWRRWHRTLSRFLRDYLYIPLGGNRKGRARRYVNLMITMLLGGLWHGAGWTFVLWGGLHGLLLMLNHGWRALRPPRPDGPRGAGRVLAGAATFFAVVAAWVLFRAPDLDAALGVYAGMLGAHGPGPRPAAGTLAWIAFAAAIAFGLPNSQQWMADEDPVLDGVRPARGPLADRLRWRPTAGWALAVALLAIVALTHLTRVSEFLYFQF
jgi:D-alanyl-lipoteichoic acid acyltransferase DltB (MBOAT superfamily)